MRADCIGKRPSTRLTALLGRNWGRRRGWQESDLAARHRSDPGKLAIAARLRKETTLPIRWIAARVKIGTPKGAKAVLHRLAHGRTARRNEACAQLEF